MKKKGPEAIIQDRLVSRLRSLKWVVKETHGNLFQQGVPDLYAACIHKGVTLQRWIEVKNPTGYRFTPAQLEFFHQLAAVGVGVWVLTDSTDDEIGKLFKSANWVTYLGVWK